MRAVREHDNAWLTMPPSTDTPSVALVLLNTPPRPASALRQLWALSSYRVCADAAANRLRDSIQLAMGTSRMVSGNPANLRERLEKLQHISQMHESMVPDVVTGDFDSIRADVLEFYRQRGCTIAFDPDPNCTDFDKVTPTLNDGMESAVLSPTRPSTVSRPRNFPRSGAISRTARLTRRSAGAQARRGGPGGRAEPRTPLASAVDRGRLRSRL